LNPGSPTPQAGILIQTSRQNTAIPCANRDIHGFNLLLDDDPALSEYNSRIIKTLVKMLADGKKLNTRKQVCNTLRGLNRHVDLMNPEEVKLYISSLKKKNGEPAQESTKQKKANNYDYFVVHNGLTWEKPVYRWDTKIPITPTKTQAEQIISAAPTVNAATIFRILLESGFEGEELHNTTEADIDTEQGIITVAGTKGHRGRAYKFKESTKDMLKLYIANHKRLHPFPRPCIMGDTWRKARKRAAEKIGNSELKKIPLKGLRNLSGILLWQKCKDPWTVMLHMGHKKLDTTQHYLSAMTAQQATETDFTTKAVKLGTPTTIPEAIELSDAGFTKFTEIDRYQLFRKPK
jgi:integrase